MGEDKKTLGERALACGMRWGEGTLDVRGSRSVTAGWVYPNGTLETVSDYGKIPDVDDPGTQGCILAQASERWAAYWKGQRGDPALEVRRVTGGWQWRLSVATRHPSDGEEDVAFCSSSPVVPTYGEACVSALEGAPS